MSAGGEAEFAAWSMPVLCMARPNSARRARVGHSACNLRALAMGPATQAARMHRGRESPGKEIMSHHGRWTCGWATKRARAATSCRPWTESDAELGARYARKPTVTQTHHLFPICRLTGHSSQINVFFCSRAPLRVTTQYQSSSASPRRLSPPGQAH